MRDDALARFEDALAVVLLHEGGFSDNPVDRGGRTMRGVTQAAFNEWLTKRGQPVRDVLGITPEELRSFYRSGYWTPAQCHRLPSALAVVHFDAAVNHGPGRANKLLQRAVNVPADGIVGPVTLGAVDARPVREIIEDYLWERVAFYRGIIAGDSSQLAFIGGWLGRLRHLRGVALKALALALVCGGCASASVPSTPRERVVEPTELEVTGLEVAITFNVLVHESVALRWDSLGFVGSWVDCIYGRIEGMTVYIGHEGPSHFDGHGISCDPYRVSDTLTVPAFGTMHPLPYPNAPCAFSFIETNEFAAGREEVRVRICGPGKAQVMARRGREIIGGAKT